MQKCRETLGKYHRCQQLRGRTPALQLSTEHQRFTNDNNGWKHRGMVAAVKGAGTGVCSFFVRRQVLIIVFCPFSSSRRRKERGCPSVRHLVGHSLVWFPSFFPLHFLSSNSSDGLYLQIVISWQLVMSWAGTLQCQQDRKKKNRKIYASQVL